MNKRLFWTPEISVQISWLWSSTTKSRRFIGGDCDHFDETRPNYLIGIEFQKFYPVRMPIFIHQKTPDHLKASSRLRLLKLIKVRDHAQNNRVLCKEYEGKKPPSGRILSKPTKALYGCPSKTHITSLTNGVWQTTGNFDLTNPVLRF